MNQVLDLEQADRFRFMESVNKLIFEDAMVRIIDHVAQGDTRFNPACSKPQTDYPTKNICAYNIAKSFIEAKHFLEKNVS